MNPDEPVSWQRAIGVAAVWTAALTMTLGGATVILGIWGAQDRTTPIPFWCHLGCGPVILLAFLSASNLSGRIHRSARIEKLVGVFSVPSVVLVLLCWLYPDLIVIRFGP